MGTINLLHTLQQLRTFFCFLFDYMTHANIFYSKGFHLSFHINELSRLCFDMTFSQSHNEYHYTFRASTGILHVSASWLLWLNGDNFFRRFLL